jgi:hypothetical protein
MKICCYNASRTMESVDYGEQHACVGLLLLLKAYNDA